MNHELPDVLEKAEEPEIKLPTSTESSKKQESSRKKSVSALLTMPKPLTVIVDHNKLWKILKEMGMPDHPTCLLRNLYAGQETTLSIPANKASRDNGISVELFQILKDDAIKVLHSI